VENKEEEHHSNGFIFLNSLGVPLTLTVEGTDLDEMKTNIFSGMIGKTSKDEEAKYRSEGERDRALAEIDKADPKAHFKMLAIHRDY
jgi:hypothetical protein